MKTHVMKLNDIPFDATKARKKVIEVRLNDERRGQIQVGDVLEFHRVSNNEILSVSVSAIRKYKSLQELTRLEDISKTGGIYRDRHDWINAINSYYSTSDQDKYGLLSIEMQFHDF